MEMNEIAHDDDGRSEMVQDAVFKLIADMRELIAANPDHMTPAAGIEMVRLAVAMLNEAENIDGIQEIIRPEDIDFKASVWGQILMCVTEEHMPLAHKQWLMSVASHMSPDWLEWLRRDVAFMVKVESF